VYPDTFMNTVVYCLNPQIDLVKKHTICWDWLTSNYSKNFHLYRVFTTSAINENRCLGTSNPQVRNLALLHSKITLNLNYCCSVFVTNVSSLFLSRRRS